MGAASRTAPQSASWWTDHAKLLVAPRMTILVLSAIVLFAAAVRFWDLGGPSLWMDELFSVKFAQMPQSQLWSSWMIRETNPPLYYSLLGVWIDVFGRGEFAARALAVLFGLLSIPVMYLIGRQAHSHTAGLMSALLTAASSEHLLYSQQVRGYSLGFLAAAVAIYALLRLTDRWRNPSAPRRLETADLAIYWAAASVAIYTHTTFVILPLLANLYVLWLWWARTERSPAVLRNWIIANVAVLGVCSWWLWITFLQMTQDGGVQPVAWIEMPTVRLAFDNAKRLFGTREFGPVNYLFDVVSIALALWGLSRMSLERRVLLTSIFLGLPILLYLISYKQPIYIGRTIFWAQAAYIPAIAAGAVAFPLRRLALPLSVAIVSIWSVDALLWQRNHYIEPWREMGKVLAARAGPNDALMAGSASALVDMEYYCSGRCREIPRIALRQPAGREVFEGYYTGAVVDSANIQRALIGVDHLWVMHRGENRALDKLVASVAVLEQADVLVDDEPVAKRRMRLSRWRVTASDPSPPALTLRPAR